MLSGELRRASRQFQAMAFLSRLSHEDGEIVSHDGAWLAGVDGALPGIVMPGTFLLGSRYFQEVAPGVALDRAEHTAEGLVVETEAGEFEGCVEIIETSPLEPGAESRKLYCPGVGLVMDDDLLLVEIGEGWLPAAGWAEGRKLRYPDGAGTVDAEGVTAVHDASADRKRGRPEKQRGRDRLRSRGERREADEDGRERDVEVMW